MKFKIFLTVMIASFICVAGVNAETINVSSGDDLASKVASANAGDTLVIADGTYNGDITISKDITLKGASRDGVIINGTVIVNTASVDVTLDTLTINDSSALIDIKAQSTVNINNATVAYTGYNGTYNTNSADGIWVERTANGTELNITNSDVAAKYAVWVSGADNNISITGSTLTGYAALDISNGVSQKPNQVEGNIVNVSDSTLTGYNTYSGSSDNYGTIVIGGQKGLQLDIDNSVVTNLVTNVVEDLIVISSSYSVSENVEINITNSELINNAPAGNSSAVYNVTSSSNINNNVVLDNTDVSATNGIIYGTLANYVYVTINVFDVQSVLAIPTGSSLDGLDEYVIEIDGYNFEGWFTDNTYETLFDDTKLVTENINLYAKFVEIPTEDPVIPDDKDDTVVDNYNDIDKDLDDVPYTGGIYQVPTYLNYLR